MQFQNRNLGAGWLKSLRQSVLNLVFPAACASCGQEFAAYSPEIELCFSCRESFRLNYPAPCPRCAMPAAMVGDVVVSCRECQTHPHRFGRAIAVGKYDGLLRNLVLRAKSGRDDPLTIALGQLAAELWLLQPAPPVIDGIVAVPTGRLRRLFRPANVAEVLAEAIADKLRVKVSSGALQLRRNIKRQADLSAAQRRRNVRQAMTTSATYDIAGAHLLLIDDVLTTGATADEATRALLTAGAAEVSVLVIARGFGLE